MSDNVKTFEGKKVNVNWDKRLCIHIGECGRAKGDLFVGGRDPWCQPDRSESHEVLDVVKRCPTGALTFERKDGGPSEAPVDNNTVIVANNGPLYLQGDLKIDGAKDDMKGVKFRAALCRCGRSKNKPFCDNAHEEVEFRDRGAVGESGDTLESTGGPLVVKRAKDGPLLVQGNFTIVSGSGREAWHGTKAALCRCGYSQNKPFCDGAHKEKGFSAE